MSILNMDLLPKEYYEMRERNAQRFYKHLLELALHERSLATHKGKGK
jgi:hypothetical protein